MPFGALLVALLALNAAALVLLTPDTSRLPGARDVLSVARAWAAWQQGEEISPGEQRSVQIVLAMVAVTAGLALLPKLTWTLTIGGLLLVAALLLPQALFRGRVPKGRALALDEAVPGFVAHLSLLLADGLSVFQALEQYRADFPDTVLAAELERLLRAVAAGQDLAGAMSALAERYASPTLRDLALALPTILAAGRPGAILDQLLARVLGDLEAERTRQIEQKVLASVTVAVLLLLPALLVLLLEPAVYLFIGSLR